MSAAATIRVQVETTLARRVPAALTLKIRQAPELFATGIAEVDTMLGGGVPRSSITEVSGAASTGKTSFALSLLANVTRLGNACAWVDVNDALSPESAAAANVELQRLLWLRMSGQRMRHSSEDIEARVDQALRSTDLLLQTGGFAAIVLDIGDVLPTHTRKIPLTTWYRFRLAAEHARTALIFLSHTPCSHSCAALSLRCDAAEAKPFSKHGETALFERQQFHFVRERNRNESSPYQQKKPTGRVSWNAATQWTRCG